MMNFGLFFASAPFVVAALVPRTHVPLRPHRAPAACAVAGIDTLFAECPLERLSSAFYEADENSCGELDTKQFAQALQRCNQGTNGVEGLFQAIDADSSGLVSINEFLAPRVVQELCMELPVQRTSVIEPFRTECSWLWRKWSGTVLVSTWKPALCSMAVGAFLSIGVRVASQRHCPLPSSWSATWQVFTTPDPKHPVIARLLPLAGVWDKQLTLTSFVVTFFVGQALAFWRKCYENARSVASRLSDLLLMLAAHAARIGPRGAYTPAAKALLLSSARHSRLFHLLYWASVVRRYSAAGSNAGLRLLKERGHCTAAEVALLEAIPQKQRHHAVASWLVAAGEPSGADLNAPPTLVGMDVGQWIERCTALRSAYGKIGQSLAARMPIQYLHLVQILVDTLLFLAPFAMFARFGTAAVPLVGMLVCFYRGLVTVSKSFLDPFGNANTDVEIEVPVLVKEQFSASTRFLDAAAVLPPIEAGA